MILKQVEVRGFRSVRDHQPLHVDPCVTILVGANDSGKSNLLSAIEASNDDYEVDSADTNWDLPEGESAKLRFHYALEKHDAEFIQKKIEEAQDAARRVATSQEAAVLAEMGTVDGDDIHRLANDAGDAAAKAVTEGTPPPADEADVQGETPADPPEASTEPEPQPTPPLTVPEVVVMTCEIEPDAPSPPPTPKPEPQPEPEGGDAESDEDEPEDDADDDSESLEIEIDERLAALPGVLDYLRNARPRVVRMSDEEQLVDEITLAQLKDPAQEFMQGIFRYAGLWDDREMLFRQNERTDRKLSTASRVFTERIRDEWQQGEDLEFTFKHAGADGNTILFRINDPAVANQSVRPSRRSTGFSSFFEVAMRLLAKTESDPGRRFVFLFDEPGTALHPSGQVNLQRVFERLALDNQFVYATHSIFLINHNRPQRNRVISKTPDGTQVDAKPYRRNWRAVRQSLGLMFAGTFFFSDTTLLVEGESDAFYIGGVLAALDRAGLIDVDLNLFSVKWAGNARDLVPMARLMVEEGRRVVAMFDGDKSGGDMKKQIERFNESIADKDDMKPVAVQTLPRNESIENVVPMTGRVLDAVEQTGRELFEGAFRRQPEGAAAWNTEAKRAELEPVPTDKTLGRHLEDVSEKWFEDVEPVSKLAVARNYCAWLDQADLAEQGVTSCPAPLLELISALGLETKASTKAVFHRS